VYLEHGHPLLQISALFLLPIYETQEIDDYLDIRQTHLLAPHNQKRAQTHE